MRNNVIAVSVTPKRRCIPVCEDFDRDLGSGKYSSLRLSIATVRAGSSTPWSRWDSFVLLLPCSVAQRRKRINEDIVLLLVC